MDSHCFVATDSSPWIPSAGNTKNKGPDSGYTVWELRVGVAGRQVESPGGRPGRGRRGVGGMVVSDIPVNKLGLV